jgi:hypothetical protein
LAELLAPGSFAGLGNSMFERFADAMVAILSCIGCQCNKKKSSN